MRPPLPRACTIFSIAEQHNVALAIEQLSQRFPSHPAAQFVVCADKADKILAHLTCERRIDNEDGYVLFHRTLYWTTQCGLMDRRQHDAVLAFRRKLLNDGDLLRRIFLIQRALP